MELRLQQPIDVLQLFVQTCDIIRLRRLLQTQSDGYVFVLSLLFIHVNVLNFTFFIYQNDVFLLCDSNDIFYFHMKIQAHKRHQNANVGVSGNDVTQKVALM